MAIDVLTTLCLADPGDPRALLGWRRVTLAPAIVLPWFALVVVHAVVLRRSSLDATRLAAAVAGHALLAVALVSPLCRYAAMLASAHMAQHIVLVALAPLLLVAGGLRVGGGRLAAPTLAYAAAIWAWHVPAWYEAALLSAPVHLLMVGSLIATSLWFWSAVLVPRFAAVPALLASLIQTGLLAALLTFANAPLYPLMALGAVALERDALADQQLAGLLMWVPMGAVFLAAALWQIARVLAAPDAVGRTRPAT